MKALSPSQACNNKNKEASINKNTAKRETARSLEFNMFSPQVDALLQPLLVFSKGGLAHATGDQLKGRLNAPLRVFHRGYTADVDFALDDPHAQKSQIFKSGERESLGNVKEPLPIHFPGNVQSSHSFPYSRCMVWGAPPC